jgi:NAD(P)-dependent dehydrogenase (short-subunit alcohol dehydrogenase family)
MKGRAMSFAGRTVVITGGVGGIGLEVGRHLLALDARVILADLDPERGQAAAESLGKGASFIPLDVREEQGWREAMAEIHAGHGALYALVNAAGIFKPAVPFTEMSLETWRAHFNVNLDGTFLGCKYGMLAMKESGGGAIVNFSSGLAQIMLTDGAAYCVSKAGVLALTRLAAKAGGKFGVRVNAVLPGAIETEMMWGNLRPGQQRQELVDMLVKQHPIGRIGVPADVAQAVSFLCDPASSFITGSLLAVDGGQLVN